MRCEHETGPWPAGQQWPACLKCEIERLRQYEPLKGGVSVREWALQENLKLAEEGLANYAQENERLTLHKDVAQKHIDALTAQYGQLRDLLREWLKGCPNPPEWHWSFDLNVRTVNTLNSSREPQTCEHTQQK